jgi:hypothetical protein
VTGAIHDYACVSREQPVWANHTPLVESTRCDISGLERNRVGVRSRIGQRIMSPSSRVATDECWPPLCLAEVRDAPPWSRAELAQIFRAPPGPSISNKI